MRYHFSILFSPNTKSFFIVVLPNLRLSFLLLCCPAWNHIQLFCSPLLVLQTQRQITSWCPQRSVMHNFFHNFILNQRKQIQKYFLKVSFLYLLPSDFKPSTWKRPSTWKMKMTAIWGQDMKFEFNLELWFFTTFFGILCSIS